ncbi:hypothetical protein N5J77_29620 [Sphingobium yanoikuyae]|jgi:hypothetical protein|nr:MULTISPECIES: hypothetical protein [Bacteria]MBE0455531.1 hypothetical protein [Roseovarius sp.]MBW0282162.1 hypothetical protein [Shewanella xiamenensis]MBW7465385.1 hypothetical protein [Staphylococcus aureus]MBB6193905.1 hypothetical protein [Sphingobium wenxiniae]MCP2374886.1 hypothetical protein [Akkermansia muciniphila]
MTEVRMTLREASDLLSVPQNTLRSRYKAGKMRGERDNSGRLWVWVEPTAKGSNRTFSKNTKKVRDAEDFEALKGQVTILHEQLSGANAELAILRSRASQVDRLEAEMAALETQAALIREDRDHWRTMAQNLAIARVTPQPMSQRGFWSRLFSRQGGSPSGDEA